MFQLICASMAIAVALFAVLLLKTQSASYSRTPIIGLLITLAAIATGPLLLSGSFEHQRLYISFLPSLFFVLLLCVWLYHDNLVSQHEWQWQSRHWPQLIPVGIGLLLTVILWLLPKNEFEQMFFGSTPVTTAYTRLVAQLFFIVMCIWCVTSLLYVWAIIQKTTRYQQALKHAYANEDGKTLNWVTVVAGALVVLWLYALLVLVFEEKYAHLGLSASGLLMLYLAVTVTVAAFGVRQQPGFIEMYEGKQESTKRPQVHKQTYSSSALNNSDLDRIAKKLEMAITADKVYLEPSLNLASLAKHISVPSQYISQTLSQHLHTSFFDFINEARIEDAKHQLLLNNKSVIDIALDVGFNARSSFYKAFKQITGLTPSEFKKQSSATAE